MTTILIPLDGSAFSRRVLPYLRQFFTPAQHTVVLLQVGDEPEVVPLSQPHHTPLPSVFVSSVGVFPLGENPDHHVYRSQVWESTLASLRDDLQPDARQLRDAGYSVRIEARCGDPATEICAYAAEHAVDLILMTTHGRTGLRRLALGSVATEVLRIAPVPVLVVPPFERGSHRDAHHGSVN